MIQAWKNDQRVKTLKIVIQVREKKKTFSSSIFLFITIFRLANY